MATPQGIGAAHFALTGYGQSQDKERVRQAGFDHHASKPADPHYLLGLLEKIAQRA